jgi:hypothetical protein
MTLSEKNSALCAWHRSNLILKHLEQASNDPFPSDLTQPFPIYAYLYHALLFVVLDFLKEKDSIPPSVESEISTHWDNLRLFRNAVFHVQDDIESPKVLALTKSMLSIKTVVRVHNEIGQFLANLSPSE